MKHRTPLTLVILLASLVIACGGGSPTPSPTGQTLDGRTFLSTKVDGPALVAGTVIRITFKDGNVSVNAGCNSFGGPYRVDGSNLVVGQIGTTEIGCAPNLMAQDQWISGLLGGATIGLDGNSLTLALSGIRVTFVDRVVADPDRPLLGTRWVVDGIIAGGVVSSVPAGVTAAITLTDTHVDVETGCNTGGATARVVDGSVVFSELVLTKKACLNGTAALESAVVAMLRGTASYAIQADALTLQSGPNGITLRAAP